MTTNNISLIKRLSILDAWVFRSILLPQRVIISRGILSLSGLAIMSFLALLMIGSDLLTPFARSAGSIGLSLLLAILITSPVAELTKLKIPLFIKGLRRQIGILIGVLITLHSMKYLQFVSFPPEDFDRYSVGIICGGIGAVILIVLTLTSNAFSQKKLGRYWHTIQKGAYFALLFGVIHAVALSNDIGPAIGLGVYALLKAVLLFKKYAPKSA